MLVAADIYRPAAINQLQTVGKQIDIPVYSEGDHINASSMCNRPAVSMITKSKCSSLACFNALVTICCGFT
jgi:signal recognition particle GTPase